MFRSKFMKRVSLIMTLALALASLQASTVSAVRPDSAKATVSDSRPATTANYTFVVNMSASTSFAAGDTMIFDWPADFTFPSDGTWVTGDFSFNDGSARTITSVGASPTCNAGTDNVSVTASQTNRTLTVTACTSYSASSTGVDVTFTAGGTNKVTNAAAGSYQINVAGTYGDDAQDVAVAMIAGVTVSATIDETLTFSINAVNSGSCQTTGGTAVTSTSTTIPFGSISTEAFYDVCQDVRVATNAGSGYSATVQTQTGLDSGANAFAKGTCDGSCTDSTEEEWSTATNNGYGICVKDTSGDAGATAGWSATNECGDATQHFRTVADISAADTAQSIMSSAAGASDDRTNVGWRLSADAAQAAGAYTGTAVYIATPTF